MNEALSFCPASISLLFKTYFRKNPVETGSTGVGFTLDQGIICKTFRRLRNRIFFNKKEIRFPTVAYVRDHLTSESVDIYLSSELPLGCGFGLSGASALSSAFALNKLFNLNKSKEKLIKLAHIAEVINKTGLGTVATQSEGGFLVRTKPGIPGSAYQLPLTGQKIWAIILKPVQTPGILKNRQQLNRINIIAGVILKKIAKLKKPDINMMIDYSYEFAKKSGLLDKNQAAPIIELIRKQGEHATITMLGEVVLTSSKPVLDKKYIIKELKIEKDRPRIIKINN